jgi:hypothetical protein
MSKLRDLLRNCTKESPFEGTEVNFDKIEVVIEGLLKGIITESSKYTLTKKGYLRNGKYHSRQDIISTFLYNL